MIETIIQFETEKYPFEASESGPGIKVGAVEASYDSHELNTNKKKFQFLKNNSDPSIINLVQIYQEGLNLHLIYEFVPFSFSAYLKQWIINGTQSEEEMPGEKKNIMKIFAEQLGALIDYFVSFKIETKLDFESFGIMEQEFMKRGKLKYFIGHSFIVSDRDKDQLYDHYSKQRKNMLRDLQKVLNFSRKSEYLPNFIIRGHKLIFTDELSDTTTRKNSNAFQNSDTRSQKGFYNDNSGRKYSVGGRKGSKNWGKHKERKHKNSCNFDQSSFYDNQNMNNSFDESQISITKTKSIKFEIEHQKSNQRNRKNSYKFKITTCEEIQIDEDSPNFDLPPRFHRPSNMNQPEDKEDKDDMNKNYKAKVMEAKKKAENLLNQYFRVKKKSTL